MSRSGRRPIKLPNNVEVKVEGGKVKVKGPKGASDTDISDDIEVVVEEGAVHVRAKQGVDGARIHGLQRALINNLIVGVSNGFEKRLEMIGVGFRSAVKGNRLELQVGYSHPTELDIPAGLSVQVEKNTLIIISGMDPQTVGQFAADIRSTRPPEPYKGKGIRYVGEYVRRKSGKTTK